MNAFKQYLSLMAILFVAVSCTRDVELPNSNVTLFDTFWKYIDEHYIFVKEQKVNWDSIYVSYRPKFVDATTDNEVDSLFTQILSYVGDDNLLLKKGSIIAYRKADRNVNFFKFSLTSAYYKFYNVFQYEGFSIVQMPENITYIHIAGVDDEYYSNIAKRISNYNHSKGIVIDLRANGGGCVNDLDLVKLFFDGSRTLYYSRLKTGIDNNSYSDYIPTVIKGDGIIDKSIPIVVLVSSNTYSHGNLLAYCLRSLSNVTIVGDNTRGGSIGGILTVVMPNGWYLDYSIVKLFSLSKQSIEFGLEPDIKVVPSENYWNEEYLQTGKDIQLEEALKFLHN